MVIPDGCKATIKDGVIIFEKEEKEQEFEDGDVLYSVYSGTMLIFKEEEKGGSKYFYSHYNTDGSSNKGWNSEAFRHATEEEKKQLFDKMKEQRLRWNAEEKKVEKIRWRAKDGEKYHYVFSTTEVNDTTYYNSLANRLRVENGNCFRTEEQAEEAAKRVKETLRKYHEEIGE